MATDDMAFLLSELAGLRSQVSEVRRMVLQCDAILARTVDRAEANNAAWRYDLAVMRAKLRQDGLSV